jgi:hypothetical protein
MKETCGKPEDTVDGPCDYRALCYIGSMTNGRMDLNFEKERM